MEIYSTSIDLLSETLARQQRQQQQNRSRSPPIMIFEAVLQLPPAAPGVRDQPHERHQHLTGETERYEDLAPLEHPAAGDDD